MKKLKISNIFKLSPTPTSVIQANDPEFTFVMVNDAYCKMTMRTENELIGNSLFDAFPENPNESKPTGPDKLISSFRKVIKTKKEDELKNIRYDIVLDGGEYKEVFWKVINTPIFDEDGKVAFILNSATQITEQVLSQRINKMMLDNSEDSFILIDKNLIIKNFNKSFADNYEEIFGKKVIKGHSILDFAQPERREIVKQVYKRVFKGETIKDLLPFRTKEGNTRIFEIKYKPAYDNNNELVGSFISLLERTAEQKAKLELEQNEAHFRALVENGNDILFILDENGQPTYASPSVKKILGYDPEEVVDLNFLEKAHPDDVPMIKSELARCLDKPGEPLRVPPARIKDVDGKWHWFEGTITNMLHDPAIGGIVDNFREITERRNAEIIRDKTLNQLAERVKEQRCLYEISKLEEQELSVKELLEKAILLIPQGWQFPEYTQVKIQWRDLNLRTPGYSESKWKLHRKKRLQGHDLEIHIVFTGNEDLFDETPFLNEEKDLLHAIADQLSLKIEQIHQRKEIEQHQKHIQNIMDQSLDMICTVRDFKFVSVSAASEKILGYKPQEMVGRPLSDFIAEDDLEETLEVSEYILEEHEVTDFENRYYHKDGHKVTLFWSARYNKKDDLTFSIARDATELKAAQKARELERINKEALINNTNDLIWSVDSKLNLITGNKAFKNSIKIQFGEDVTHGLSILNALSGDKENQKKWEALYNRALTGESFRIENKEEGSKEDNPTWFEISFNPIVENNNIEGVACFAHNITETKIAQLEKQRAEQKYRNVVEHSTNMFYQHDTEGVLTYVSPQSKDFLGYPPEEAMRKWTEFITDHPLNEKGEALTLKAIETGEIQPPYELQLKTGDGRIIWVEVHEAPLTEGKKVTGIVGSLTDITARKNYEQELQQSLERYDYASKATKDAIYDWDIANDHHHWGDGFESLFGHNKDMDQFSVDDWLAQVHPDDVEEIRKDLEFSLEDESFNQWQFEYRFRKANGDYAYVVDNAYIIRDMDGKAIRMIGAVRDITEEKKTEIQTKLQHQVAQFFKNEDRLPFILSNVLEYLAEFQKFNLAEIWLVDTSKSHLTLISTFARDKQGKTFYEESKRQRKFGYGEGLPGTSWKKNSIQTWKNISAKNDFVRSKAAQRSGLKSASALPLYSNEEVVGVLVLGSSETQKLIRNKIYPYESLQSFLGAEIRRKQQEELIQQTNKKLKNAQSIAKLGYWELDLESDQLFWSEEVFHIWGNKNDEPYNFEEFRKTIHPEDLKKFDEQQQKALAGEQSLNIEHRIILPDGQIKWVHELGNLMLDEQGNPISFQGTVQDITDQKQSELALEKAYNEKENILESIGDGFFTLDKNWNVTYWNRAAEILLQTPKHKILNQNLWDIFEDAVDLPSYTNYHRVMHQRKQVSFEDYYENIDKWFDVNAYPSAGGISVFFKDISERKKAREQLEKLNRELEIRADELAATNTELEQFAYVASHDLQEPLRMVTSFLTQLDKKYADQLDEKANQYIDFAVDGAQRMRQIILDLLNYSRLNQEKSKRGEVDLDSVIEDVKVLERSHIEEMNAQIKADPLPVIYANPGPIKQVFQNLINNALKYQPSGNAPVIEISCSETDTHWKFTVKDNGIGIREEFQSTIFQIFQRLHTNDQYSGTGIGLAITKKIIERHGGEIWLESEEGRGSTFYFTIQKI